MISTARIGEKGNVEYFGRQDERQVAADTLAKAHLLLLIMGIVFNNLFKLDEDALLEKLGKVYGEAWPVAEAAG